LVLLFDASGIVFEIPQTAGELPKHELIGISPVFGEISRLMPMHLEKTVYTETI